MAFDYGYECHRKLRIIAPIKRYVNKNWRADKLDTLVWNQIEHVLDTPAVIMVSIGEKSNYDNSISILGGELLQIDGQLRALKHDQQQLLQWALKGLA